MAGIYIKYFLAGDIFYNQSLSLQYFPDYGIQYDSRLLLAGKAFCNIKTTHPSKPLLFFEKEKLVGLHQELPTDFAVIVYDKIRYIVVIELFPHCKPGRARADYGYCCLENPDFSIGCLLFHWQVGFVNTVNLFHVIYLGNTDTTDFAVD
ncbi:hypothetical protein SDC9_72071 [bioreactor metagenome]|uniref:Uncharacterized protein n=1 Tax=bioreactor metagenome TaxID=1076179 RepID=A0A644YAK2_9ZZZZ